MSQEDENECAALSAVSQKDDVIGRRKRKKTFQKRTSYPYLYKPYLYKYDDDDEAIVK